jgi:DNA repair protein RecN (Recombination protein N)
VLEELRITGLGVIEDSTLHLTRGMNVITGETGAGKTMVVTGLGLLFGGRADAGRVRADRAARWSRAGSGCGPLADAVCRPASPRPAPRSTTTAPCCSAAR